MNFSKHSCYLDLFIFQLTFSKDPVPTKLAVVFHHSLALKLNYGLNSSESRDK